MLFFLSSFLSLTLFQADLQPLSLLYFLIYNILSLSPSKSVTDSVPALNYPGSTGAGPSYPSCCLFFSGSCLHSAFFNGDSCHYSEGLWTHKPLNQTYLFGPTEIWTISTISEVEMLLYLIDLGQTLTLLVLR